MMRDLISPSPTIRLSNLANLSSFEELTLHADVPQSDTFAYRIRTREFWRSRFFRKDQISHSPAIEFYLRDCFEKEGVASFEEHFSIWTRSFYEARMDQLVVRYMLILFLNQNVEILRHLYILEQPYNQDVESTEEALQVCFNSPENRSLFPTSKFSRWVLDDWLPFHLSYYHCKDEYIGKIDDDDL